jgi:hypothetical protein
VENCTFSHFAITISTSRMRLDPCHHTGLQCWSCGLRGDFCWSCSRLSLVLYNPHGYWPFSKTSSWLGYGCRLLNVNIGISESMYASDSCYEARHRSYVIVFACIVSPSSSIRHFTLEHRAFNPFHACLHLASAITVHHIKLTECACARNLS